MKLTDTSISRSITTIMVYIALLVIGYVSYYKMPLDLLPDLEFPVAVVIIEYPDVGPKEVESTITRPIEEVLAGINNIETITSVSKEGFSIITMKFIWGTNMSLAVSDMRERMDMVKGLLPEDIKTPIVLKFDISMMPIMVLSVSGPKDPSALREYAEDHLKNQFEQIDGVASAYVYGGQKTEVKIDLNKNRMDAYGLSIDQIITLLRMENMNIAGGDIKSPKKKYTLRTRGDFRNLNDIRNVVVTVKNSAPIYLKDIAKIYEGPAEEKEIVHLNGENGVVIRLNKQSDKNTVLVGRNIIKQLNKIKETLPKGIEIAPIFSSADFIELSISNVVDNAVQGGVLAVLVVLIFLRNIRSSLIMGLSIPISIVITFIFMYMFDISLNMMSMGGLALGVGMLIDNSIVVMENIFHFREKGARPTEAARLGTDEMGMAITASTLTNLVVFVPLLFTQGLASQLFKQMALTITFSQICSLVVALTLIPMLTARYVHEIHHEYKRFTFMNTFFKWSEERFKELENFYAKSIKWALDHRKRVVLYTFLSMIFGIILITFFIGKENMPEQDDGRLTFTAKFPIGTNLKTSDESLRVIEKRILKVLKPEEYKVVSVRAGYGEGFAAAFAETSDHTARIEMRLVSITERKRSIQEIRKALRDELIKMPGVNFNFNVQNQGLGRMMGSGGSDISIQIFGYDFEESKKFTELVYKSIKGIPGLKDAEISREEGLPEKVIEINREKASKIGLNASYLANLVKNNIAGKVASIYRKEGKEYDITVRLREEDRKTLEDIKQINVTSPTGVTVPLGNFIDIKDYTGPTTIEREKQERVTYINCQAEGRALNEVADDIQKRIDKLVKPANFNVTISGAYKDMQDTFKDIALAVILAIILIYIVMAAQFESLLSPFIVMFSIPTLIFGVMTFLFITGSTFNVISFMGILMLTGIVVNNAIVLVDYTDILRARGMQVREALMEAGKSRLRPILMTTFTTILGLIPMALGLGEGAELSSSLARSVMGGMSSSFIFTLFFIPVLYSLFETLRIRFKNYIRGIKNS